MIMMKSNNYILITITGPYYHPKGDIIPIEPIVIPNGEYEYIYSFTKFPKYNDVMKYITKFKEHCKISELNKNDDDIITTVLLKMEPIYQLKK